MKRYTADFETATWLENETYVWAWATCEIGNENNLKIDNNIDSFIEYVKQEQNSTWYFHNLKFDGEFIIWWLEKNGFKHVIEKDDISDNTYTTLISDRGVFYSLCIYFKVWKKKTIKATFIDSLKIIPFSVEETAKCFDLSISKLELDYNKPRSRNHKITKKEKDYIKNDVLIMAKALKIIFDEKLTRMTRAGNAMTDFKNIFGGQDKFRKIFPILNKIIDGKIRESYRGGFTYLSPEYKEKNVGKGTVLDVNSLYPHCMYSKLLPYGEPVFFKGKYKDDKVYNLYIQTITCSFKLKKNKIPTIQIKNTMSYMDNEYLTSSNNEIECLTLTSVDLKLFLEQYDVQDLNYCYGFKFKSSDNFFKNYIDKWIKIKNQATLENNYGIRTIAKLMLNSLYGKFASVIEQASKSPYLGDDNIIHYKIEDKKEKDGIYLPIGTFITSYAREITIRTAQKIKDYSISKYGKNLFVYSDTDSLHCLLDIEELKQFCNIDSVKLGYWKHESDFTKARFIRQKCYLEEIDGKMSITCAGMPKNCYDKVNWKNFKTHFSCTGKLTFKHVVGGVKLIETDFTIKEEKVKKNIAKMDKLIKEKEIKEKIKNNILEIERGGLK